jgi:hypothetical protein
MRYTAHCFDLLNTGSRVKKAAKHFFTRLPVSVMVLKIKQPALWRQDGATMLEHAHAHRVMEDEKHFDLRECENPG